MDIISTDGVIKLSIRNVARKIGVSHTAPYRHFKNKDELLIAIAVEGFGLLAAFMEKSVRGLENDFESNTTEGK